MRSKNIVFLHSSSGSKKLFDPIVKMWNRTENLISFNLPGHGDAAPAEDYSWNKTKIFVQNQIDKIEGEILLLGNSLGGHLAMEIAPYMKNLKGLVVMGSPPIKKPINMEEAFAPNPYSATYYKEKPEESELEFATNGAVYNRSVLPIIKENFHRADPKIRSTLLNDIMDGSDFLDEYQIIGALPCKKYFVNGAQDPIINFNYLIQIQAEALYPIELFKIEDCGHYPTLEQPEKFLRILEKIAVDVFK